MQGRRFSVDAIDRVSLSQRKVNRAVAIQNHRPRSVERRPFQGRAVRRRLAFARSTERVDESAGEIDRSNAMIPDVADEQSSGWIDGDAVGLAKLGFRGRSAIATESGDAGSRECGNDARLRVDFSDDVIVALGDVDVATRCRRRSHAAYSAPPPSPAHRRRHRRADHSQRSSSSLGS